MQPRILPMLAGGAVLVAACADYDATVRARGPSLDEAKESRCSVVKDHSRPLIVEWPASARGDLEVRMKKGVVAVRYVGCAMEVLDRCSAGGAYRYVPFTPKEDRLVIRDKRDLYANLPMGADGLSAKLERHGEIDLGMTLVGKYETDAIAGREEDLRGDCGEATHVVTGMTVGAFALSAGGTTEVGGGVTVAGVGARAGAKDVRETLSRDGDPRMCAKATLEDTSPPRWCGAVVRVEVVPLARPLRSPIDEQRNREDLARLEIASSTLPELPKASPEPPPARPVRAPQSRSPESPWAKTWAETPASELLRSSGRTPPQPAPCEGSSVPDCMARCAEGSGPSCLTLARGHGKDQTYWFLSACIAGMADGCTGVGKAYARGEFGEPDPLTADKWYGIAAHVRGPAGP